MRIEIHDDRPPVSGEALAAAEAELARLGHHIPPSYKAFLADQDGGKPVRDLFRFRQGDRDQEDLIRLFYGVAESPNGDLVRRAGSADLPGGLLPIATDAFGNLVVLDGRDGADGPVYFWDHELGDDDAEEPELFWLAPDLQTFLDELIEEPEPEPPPPKKGLRRLFGG
jgi:SMI1 / KNR4 family (SUKH-1)